jgi:hypothetical protein
VRRGGEGLGGILGVGTVALRCPRSAPLSSLLNIWGLMLECCHDEATIYLHTTGGAKLEVPSCPVRCCSVCNAVVSTRMNVQPSRIASKPIKCHSFSALTI